MRIVSIKSVACPLPGGHWPSVTLATPVDQAIRDEVAHLRAALTQIERETRTSLYDGDPVVPSNRINRMAKVGGMCKQPPKPAPASPCAVCDCGAPLTSCASCAVADYQANGDPMQARVWALEAQLAEARETLPEA